ncbi:MAG: hypothetical protein AVDCRST_MAG73-3075, partial [uncultured Thermomicrobiales bacterium]
GHHSLAHRGADRGRDRQLDRAGANPRRHHRGVGDRGPRWHPWRLLDGRAVRRQHRDQPDRLDRGGGDRRRDHPVRDPGGRQPQHQPGL